MNELEEELARERAARLEAERANRMKDRFLAAISHELRAPLMTLLLWEKVLRDETTSPELRARALDAIHQSALAQSRLIGDLLDISRAISGKLHVDLRPVDVGALLAGAVTEARVIADAKPLTIAYEPATQVLLVDGDAGRLRQVFGNLLSNAIKFTNPGGRVTVTCELRNKAVVVEITDTGRGIAPELLPKLFEPFSQAQDPLTRAQGGLGLGLTIAYEIVALHKGALTAHSDGPGHGATFTLTLPVLQARHSVMSTPVGGRKSQLTGVHVLVVDDDRRVREALSLLLERAGAIVTSAPSASAARDQLARVKPGIVLCDISMPHEDGYAFVRSLRASGIKIPVVALTARTKATDTRHARDAGFDLHIAKPVNFEKLVLAIAELIASSAHTRGE